MFVADMNEATVYSELRKKHARKRKRQSNSDGSEQNKPRKKRPKVEVISMSSDSIISYPEAQMSSIPDSSTDNRPGIRKLKIKRVKKVRQRKQEDNSETDQKPLGDDSVLDVAKKWSGKYHITFTACFLFLVKFR
jgi:hypothetical protein